MVARSCGVPNQKDSKIIAGGSNNGGLLNSFHPPVSWEDKALCSQAHWFLYSSTHPSINRFQDDIFKTMLNDMIPAQYLRGGKKAPTLTIDMLKKYIKGKFKLMNDKIHSLVIAKYKACQGNTFAQLLHDGATEQTL